MSKSVRHENVAGSDGSMFIIHGGSLKIETQNFKPELIQLHLALGLKRIESMQKYSSQYCYDYM